MNVTLMKRTGIVCLLFALLAVTLVAPADAAKRKRKKVTREAVATYDYPTFGSATIDNGACAPCHPYLDTSAQERWITVTVEDAASPAPVAFSIWEVAADGSRLPVEGGGPFCGSTGGQPVEIRPGFRVFVAVYALGDVVCPGGISTTGTVTAVFSNLP